MKLRLILLSVAILLTAVFAVRSIYHPSILENPNQPSKVDQRILRAQQSIAKFPDNANGYNQLASAYMQKARETADFSSTQMQTPRSHSRSHSSPTITMV